MRVYLRGKTWWGDWVEDGHDGVPRRRRRSLGLRAPSVGASEALAALRLALCATIPPYTMATLLEDWLRAKRIAHHAKPRSIEAFESVARRLARRFGDLPVSELDLAAIDAYKEERLTDVCPSTLNVDLDHLRNALRFAKDRGHVKFVPEVSRVRARGRRVPKLLGRDEIARLIERVSGVCPSCERFRRLEPIVRLAIAGGLRADEARWLTWADVDLPRALLHVRAKPGWSPKSSSERTIPLHPAFAEWLDAWRFELSTRLERAIEPGDWVAPFLPLESGRGAHQGRPGQQWVRGVLTQETRRLFEAAAIPGTGRHHLHKLRGTFAVRVLEGGGSLESLREILGHADLRSTSVYLAATDASKRRAIAAAGWDEPPRSGD